MKIAVLTSRFPDPWETFIETELKALARTPSVELDIQTLKSGMTTDLQVRRNLWWDPAHLASFVLAWCRQPQIMAGIGRSLLKGFKGCPRPAEQLKSLAVWPLATALAQELPRRQVTGLFSHWANVPSTIAWMIHRLTGIPYVMEIHGENVSTVWPHLKEKCREANVVATCTKFTASQLRAGGIDCELEVLPHGTDTTVNSEVTHSSVYRLLSIGRLVPTKGLSTVARAVAELVQRGRRVRWTCVGRGPQQEELLEIVKRESIETSVEFVDWMPHEQVRELYTQHDCFVLPCEVNERGDCDGLPNVLLEAAAAGCPVISSRTGAIEELVESGVTGTLISPGNVLELAEAIEAAIKAPEEALKKAEAARIRLCRDYDAVACQRSVINKILQWFE